MNVRLSIISSLWEAFFYILSNPKILELVYLPYLELKWRRFKKYHDVIARSDHPISDLRDFVDLRGWFLFLIVNFLMYLAEIKSILPRVQDSSNFSWPPQSSWKFLEFLPANERCKPFLGLYQLGRHFWESSSVTKAHNNEEKGGESHSNQTWREHLECMWSVKKHENQVRWRSLQLSLKSFLQVKIN